ncbi:MAG: hypothetical protein IJW59_00670 [Clostridia bacterium]|nr:hypothetical protein [Clostridia bacterium]
MTDTLTLIFNIVFLVIILGGVLWGFFRGLKKTVSHLLFLILITILVFFITIPLTNLILEIPATLEIQEGSETIQKTLPLSGIIEYFVQKLLGEDFVANYPELSTCITAIPLMFLAVILYTLLFWILKYLLFPIRILLNKLLFRTKKNKVEAMGFADIGDDKPEYPNSDKSIEPLMEVYQKTQIENANEGMFIRKEDDISKDAPTAHANKIEITATQVEEPETKKEIKKREKAERKANKPKKYRLWGGLVGIAVGIVTLFNTLVPVYGFMNILKTQKTTSIEHLTDETITLSSISNGITDDIIKSYELSVLGRTSKALGLQALGVSGFDKLTTRKINNQKVTLRSDINSLIDVVVSADDLIGEYKSATEEKYLTQEELTSLISSLESVISKTESVKIVNALSDYIIPLACEILIQNDVKIVENELINQLIFDTIIEIGKNNEIKIFNELKSIVDIAKYLNEQKLLVKLVNNDFSDILLTIQNLDENFSETLTNKIFAIKIVDSTFADILNIGLSFFEDATNFGYTESDATNEEIKTAISQMVDSSIRIAQTLTEDSSIYITDNSLPSIGKLLNTLKDSNIINKSTYDNLVTYAIGQIKTLTIDIIPENFKDFFNNQLLGNISAVTDWESEMTTISNALKTLRDNENGILGSIEEGSDLRQGYSLSLNMTESTFTNIGKALDILEQSTLLGSNSKLIHNDTTYNVSSIVSFVNSLILEGKSLIDDSSSTILSDISSVIDLMQTNIISKEHLQSENSTFWQDEFSAISPLIIYINNISNAEDFELTENLGEILDKCAKNSIMLQEDTTLKLMSTLLNIVKDNILGEDYQIQNDESINDSIAILLSDIDKNLNDPDFYNTTLKVSDTFWQDEIPYLISLKNIASKADSLSDITDTLEIAQELDNVYNSKIIPGTTINKTISTILKQFKIESAPAGSVDAEINSLIDGIIDDITDPNFFEKTKDIIGDFWQVELGHIDNLLNLKLEDDPESDYVLLDELSSIGKEIDKITRGTTYAFDESYIDMIPDLSVELPRASYLITEARIRNILATVIETLSESIKTSLSDNADITSAVTETITDMTTNLKDTENIKLKCFQLELLQIQLLADIKISNNLFKYSEDTQSSEEYQSFEDIGDLLDSIGHNLMITTYADDPNTTTIDESISIISYNENLNSKLITRENLNNIICSAFSSALIEGNDLNATQTMFNSLIENIQESISNLKEHTIIDSSSGTDTTITIKEKVISWKRELSYITTLININSGKTFTLDPVESTDTEKVNIAQDVAPSLDLIAFNCYDSTDESSYIIQNSDHKFLDLQYNENNEIIGHLNRYLVSSNGYLLDSYNSVIITREIISSAVNQLLDTFKIVKADESELDDIEIITNELIENMKNNINDTNTYTTNKYNNYTQAFTDLSIIKNNMETISNNIDSATDLESIQTLFTEEQAKDLDSLLEYSQSTFVGGIATTRKIALMIAEKLDTILDFSSPEYLENLITHYNNSIEQEYYLTTDEETNIDESLFPNPFVTLQSEISKITN